ncbi:MAG: OmpH family outer membrane protein [Acidobacteria bacterium]|nr:OmpH family outer membrane protein [Acidobacteriota bacterium]
MKLFRLMSAAIMLAALAALPTLAQATRPATTGAPAAARPAAPTTAAPAGQAVTTAAATGKIAVIDSRAFSDEKEGIARVANAIKSVYAQFQPMRTEVEGLQKRYEATVADIQKTKDIAAPAELQKKADEAERLKKEYERKAQDMQDNGQRRMAEVLGPLQEDVQRSLQAYAQQRGISIIIDAGTVPLVYVANGVDITREFIADYNRTKPATASAATPAAGRP